MTTQASPQESGRPQLLQALAGLGQVDLAIIGGGATGLGVALDAAQRGLSVVLLESHDFAKGTSSRATKLVHGGVRYLAQGNIALVREALHERATLLHNAPHLARPLPFVVPGYKCWEVPFYGVGLKAYDALAGKAGLGSTEFLSSRQTLQCMPGVKQQGLKGGVKYWDGQFDDARLALALARTAAAQGALIINYCPVTELIHEQGKVVGLRCTDNESGQAYTVNARCVVNATGVWVDHIRQKDGDAGERPVQPMVAPSQGVHLVVDSDFFPGDHALLVPKTQDGRVLFAVPWLGKVILGTTDTPRHDLSREPDAFVEEVNFILGEAGRYLKRAPTRADVKSIWVGLRPLVRPPDNEGNNTKKISREHTVLVSPSGLVTVTGGKWTTYRAMAEDTLQKCMDSALLQHLPPSRTADLPLVGASAGRKSMTQAPGLLSYGAEASVVQSLPGAETELAPGLSVAMVRFAARYEYARTVEDVLARRTRLLFLDAKLAEQLAAAVAAILQEETGVDPQLNDFLTIAAHYQYVPV
ncbi:glycerol-3-phosphate dehydrogenase/oxidase [Pollutimonas harenae]|uniref:Glycerol-3-phosphate dehydrogenase/oxidase n=1 Tax=Pollutimonas harenae TaxID=657015 RepID=A0A853GUE3_9BURK|nr:glycerol-3-phosphate dehydrogenase/oxidase [Pollutimonas harenae]NYT86798.1 glycerol-3-phosphate dehydrogenase/oxidase [Pollutimonas harenae]TEA71444.1 glycerol-3-phosphate dehydrogenase/oxidase [Pollutimonas harenae]